MFDNNNNINYLQMKCENQKTEEKQYSKKKAAIINYIRMSK